MSKSISTMNQENHFLKSSTDFYLRKLNLKIRFLHFLRSQKELEVTEIKKMFNYKPSRYGLKYLFVVNFLV